MKNFEALKEEIKLLYSDEVFTDAELNEMTDNLIKFFAVGLKAIESNKQDDNPTSCD